MTNYKVLTQEQVNQFIELGWVKVEQAFPKEEALEAQSIVWENVEKRGVLKDDESTWTEEMVQLNETYEHDEFQKCNTTRLADAIEDLVGEGRWADRTVYGESDKKVGYGWWPVNFSQGANKPWSVPTTGWHWDGIHFRHYIDSPEQGLLCLNLFSEIGKQGGGTLVAEGSHKVIAKFLSEQPDGIELEEGIRALNKQHPWFSELTASNQKDDTTNNEQDRIEKFMENPYVDEDGIKLKVIETTGSPGDVILCHPFLYHAASQNHSGVPRFMCNRTTPLTERINLNRPDGNYSPLEWSIKSVLHKEATI
ncbi:phytanoyl-CoA dioxygenase family protein [Metabacillus litoralis]|uniref:phytanoyl-CoA dioxygenase family protein n=1 Tax=Metabacillus litoralis TaxID=152268 RepID=UPI00203ED579|nr:phytanoyl-CoA dioxygenase family protein [Metabacillus litoralis]MCM3409566.1 phytanoyl-CoA dioxygenase family protein [Metabacillus litoralis]